ncbi:MAG: hypothetical protein AB1899_13350 [Pseudomonadota bacterium]
MNASPLIACADIGSVKKGNFGWWSSDGGSGHKPSTLADWVAAALNDDQSVALGFECPLFVPLTEDEQNLTSARPGEGNRPWSAGAGCGALATGLVQVAWVLRAVRAALRVPRQAHLHWGDFAMTPGSLLIWEAFVSGKTKGSSHVADAQLAVEAFFLAMPNPESANAVRCNTPVHSLIGATLLRTGWAQSSDVLASSCLVIKAHKNAA